MKTAEVSYLLFFAFAAVRYMEKHRAGRLILRA
jgi:hypothetical protein